MQLAFLRRSRSMLLPGILERMSTFDELTAAWAPEDDEPRRACAIGELFRAVARRHRQRFGLAADAPICGSSRALYTMSVAVDDRRRAVCDRALCAALAERRSTWTLDVLSELALIHPPAFEPALQATRAPLRARPRSPSPMEEVLARAGVDALARLIGAAPESMRIALLDEMMAAAAAIDYGGWDMPYLLARAADVLGASVPEALLARVATIEQPYRVLAYALVARSLPPAKRQHAIDQVLVAPTIGDARPIVAIADHVAPDQFPRALELASALYSSPSFGATAVRALLPGWAALGHWEDAIARARAIRDPHERALALALIAPHADDQETRDALVREATAGMAPSSIAIAATALVPLGYGMQLRETQHGGASEALAGLARVASGAERARFLDELSASTDVLALQPLARQLVAARIFPSFCRALRCAWDTDQPDTFFEDECGWGLRQWMSFVPLLGGSAGAHQVAAAVVP
jgi:hypothetical protein